MSPLHPLPWQPSPLKNQFGIFHFINFSANFAILPEEWAGFVSKELLPLSEASHIVDVCWDQAVAQVVEELW